MCSPREGQHFYPNRWNAASDNFFFPTFLSAGVFAEKSNAQKYKPKQPHRASSRN